MTPRPEHRRAPKPAAKQRPWWAPTPKWWTLLVTDVAAIVGSTIVTGWDATERGMAGLAVVALATTWAKSNKTKRSSWG